MLSEIFSSEKGERMHSNRTICELHRELFDISVMCLYEKDIDLLKEIINLLEKSFIHGVEMNKRLVEYKLGGSGKWNKKEYAKSNYNRHEIRKMRKERIRLEKMLAENKDILKRSKKRRNLL